MARMSTFKPCVCHSGLPKFEEGMTCFLCSKCNGVIPVPSMSVSGGTWSSRVATPLDDLRQLRERAASQTGADLAQERALSATRAETEAWQETAEHYAKGVAYYRNLVIQIGEMFGDAAYIADDGSKQDEVLCAKVPELVKKSLQGGGLVASFLDKQKAASGEVRRRMTLQEFIAETERRGYLSCSVAVSLFETQFPVSVSLISSRDSTVDLRTKSLEDALVELSPIVGQGDRPFREASGEAFATADTEMLSPSGPVTVPYGGLTLGTYGAQSGDDVVTLSGVATRIDTGIYSVSVIASDPADQAEDAPLEADQPHETKSAKVCTCTAVDMLATDWKCTCGAAS